MGYILPVFGVLSAWSYLGVTLELYRRWNGVVISVEKGVENVCQK